MYKSIKRFLDFSAALIALTAVSPLMLICALWVKLDSKGPAIYKQKRPGKDEKIFTVYKFRTMRVETEKNGIPLSDMERVTRSGKILRMLSLDELPQLINVIKGDMSFIGPRPLLVAYLERYNGEQHRRHLVRPGISGWAQVNGRNAITWEEKFELDCWYVDHMSLWLDIKIAFMTVINVIKRDGINNSTDMTMEPFMGNVPQKEYDQSAKAMS